MSERLPRTTEGTGEAEGCLSFAKAKLLFVNCNVMPTSHVGLIGLGSRIPVVTFVSAGRIADTAGAKAGTAASGSL